MQWKYPSPEMRPAVVYFVLLSLKQLCYQDVFRTSINRPSADATAASDNQTSSASRYAETLIRRAPRQLASGRWVEQISLAGRV
ncbi:hypothetical protein BX600DRAFT_457319 [Xylariales sp. PMI_506]|nr:hypothetical protein BX600DRAFT_457319 [Xylariales sp. PMI_506]